MKNLIRILITKRKFGEVIGVIDSVIFENAELAAAMEIVSPDDKNPQYAAPTLYFTSAHHDYDVSISIERLS